MRVGRIPYLNSEPFYAGLEGYPLVPLPPRQLGDAVAAGRVDAGPLSLADVFRLHGDLVVLPLGIAVSGPAHSVILFSDRPAKELDGAIVGVTDETATSVRLLRLLLSRKYGVRPRAWVGADDAADAVLLIGDRALRTLAGPDSRPYRMDLGSEWVQWTGLPCVFARWAVRATVSPGECRRLQAALERSLEQSLAALPVLAARRDDVGLDAAGVSAYLRNFTYRFGPEEDRAIAELRRRFQDLDAAP